jgi:hypothetical protein
VWGGGGGHATTGGAGVGAGKALGVELGGIQAVRFKRCSCSRKANQADHLHGHMHGAGWVGGGEGGKLETGDAVGAVVRPEVCGCRCSRTTTRKP